jgi:hypothetical protein
MAPAAHRRPARASPWLQVASKCVQPGATLTSAEPPAFSFVLDPRVQSPEAAIADLQRRLDMPGLRLTFIRVMP